MFYVVLLDTARSVADQAKAEFRALLGGVAVE
jgi:hypothetical protein